MTSLDGLLDRGKNPGRFVERKRFTLSREKAIEKQREFALTSPHKYVLELIQSAVFAGATYIAVDAKPSMVMVAWVGGRPLVESDLNGLMDYLFADRTDPKIRHLVQLAVAVNALLQRKPRSLRIESGDGTSSVRLDLDASGSGELGVPEDRLQGTYLMAEFPTTVVSRFFAGFSQSDVTQESSLIEERCRYTPVPILLNGDAPFGYRSSRHIEIFGAKRQVRFDEDGRRGVLAYHRSASTQGFRLIIGGVWVSDLPLDDLTTEPMLGVICDDGLRKTADHSNIVQDHRYARMLHAVQPHATRLAKQVFGANYRAPKLPAIKAPQPQASGGPPTQSTVHAEPVPEPVLQLSPRCPTSLINLKLRSKTQGAQWFWCTPELAKDLDRHADPHRFPYVVLVLTEGQALTLGDELPGTQLNRLTSRADVDFVRRARERRGEIRTHRFDQDGLEITMRLHLQGALPDWGHGAPGVPICVVHDAKTVAAGTLNKQQAMWTTEHRDTVRLGSPLHLPRVSLLAQGQVTFDFPSPALCTRLLREAWTLALPPGGAPNPGLLAGLLGQQAVPQLVDQGAEALALTLPQDAPKATWTVALARTVDGQPVDLRTLVSLQGTDKVLKLSADSDIALLERLEGRLGFGHLDHPAISGRPAWAVGYTGHQWVWMDSRSAWGGALTQVILVGAHLHAELRPDEWQTIARPHPSVAYAVRKGEAPQDAAAGWELLYEHLLELERPDTWPTHDHPLGLSSTRARDMGRLALLFLSASSPELKAGILLPTDGGARRAPSDIWERAEASLVAQQGIQVHEPWTFAVTADERKVLEGGGRHMRLRYDDPPSVWDSLADDAGDGWLLRHRVHEGGLTGWLGLRYPFDATAGLLVRATGRTVGIPLLDRKIPCHGLLWPDGEAVAPTPEQQELLNLASLRLYQGLIELLSTETDPQRRRSGERYAACFALRTWRPHAQDGGTTIALARRVPVAAAEGGAWGHLEGWLRARPEDRPPLPDGLELLLAPGTAGEEAALQRQGRPLQRRLNDALSGTGWSVRVTDQPGQTAPVDIRWASSNQEVIWLSASTDHPLTAAATDNEGPQREVWLLEAARCIIRYAQEVGHPQAIRGSRHATLPGLQQALIGQRLRAR
jgi:hypothetical protein